MNRLGIPQDRIAKRFDVRQETIPNHLPKMQELANLVNSDLSRGSTVSQIVERHNSTKQMVWLLALRTVTEKGYLW
jgi:hypothetical protein